jgi:hypothetical protein
MISVCSLRGCAELLSKSRDEGSVGRVGASQKSCLGQRKRLQNRSFEAFVAELNTGLSQLVCDGIYAVGWVCRA